MKTKMKLSVAIAVIIVTAMTISISSCSKGETTSTVPANLSVLKETSAAAAFLEKLYQDATEESMLKIVDEFKALTPDQVTEFIQLKNAKDLSDIEVWEQSGELAKNGVDKDMLIEQTIAANKFRVELNERSVLNYGYSYNHLTNSNMNSLAEEILSGKSKDYGILRVSATSDVEPLACTKPPYTSLSTRTTTGTKRYYTYVRMDNEPTTPTAECDIEYRFDGNFNYYRPVRNVDYLATGSGASLLRRYLPYSDGIDTFVLCGYWGIMGWIGPYFYGLEMNMRS